MREDLIELYAGASIAEVHASAAYQKLCEVNAGNAAFHAERSRVEEARQNLDAHVALGEGSKQQVADTLRLLRRLKQRSEQQEIVMALARRLFGGGWTRAQEKYYERWAPFVVGARDYFLSFTSRNPASPRAQNQINRLHRYFIREILGRDRFNELNPITVNALAEAVHYLLRNKQLQGYYYPEHEDDGTVVRSKLQHECANSFAFVQLVQNEMFQFYATSPNWCEFEYNQAKDTDRERVLFVQIEVPINAGAVAINFTDWHQDFSDRGNVVLDQTVRYVTRTIDDNDKRISAKLADQIKRTEEAIYGGVPD